MKRSKQYRHRPGMRFDRRAVPGSPDGSFIGAEIEITTLTGSVERSVTQRGEDFELDQGRIWGYPLSPQMMTKAVGFGKWEANDYGGWLFDQGEEAYPWTTASYYTVWAASTASSSKYLRNLNEWRQWNGAFVGSGWGTPGPMGVQPWAQTGMPPGATWYGDRSFTLNNAGGTSDQLSIHYAFPFTGSDATLTGSACSMLAAFVLKCKGDNPGTIWSKMVSNGEDGPGFHLTYLSGSMLKFTMVPSLLTGVPGASASASIKPHEWTVAIIALNRETSPQTLTIGTMPLFGGDISYDTAQADTGSLSATGSLQTLGYSTVFIGGNQIASASSSLAAMYIGYGQGICGATQTAIGEEDPVLSAGGAATYSINTNIRYALANFAKSIRTTSRAIKEGSRYVDYSVGSFGSALESQYLTQKLLGLGTGALGRSSGLTTITTGSIPSWTNVHIRNSAFVVTPFSSSDHESQTLNLMRSGTQALETTAVPASATLYYSKKSTYNTLTVKKTASFFDTVVPYSGVIVPSAFAAGTGSLITIVTGSNMPAKSGSFRYPATIRLDVPQKGKLVDLKVWVEVTHHSASAGQADPLGTLGIAIRSPNLRWEGHHAHPVRNDPKFYRAFQNPAFVQAAILGSTGVDDIYFPPANFFRDSFLLWEGYAIENYNGTEKYPGPANGVDRFYPTWNMDRHMRTVFSDGSPIPNPRHLIGPVSGNYNGSPNGAFAWGNNVPWTTEAFGFLGEPTTYQAAGSPPTGWRTGPGGANNTNEWPTTGSNLGAETLRPVYPLLDGIYQRKRIGDEYPLLGTIVKSAGGIQIPQENPGLWRGFRPGLRGTEISGTWEVLFAQCGDLGDYSIGETKRINAYFRQVRLEFVYELNEDPVDIRAPQLGRAHRMGESLLSSISGSGQIARDDGSGSWDAYVSDTYLDYRGSAETGRTFGTILNTGSFNQNEYALIYRLSGTLADISGSTPGWLFNNPFGMPVIPLSSASLVEPSIQQIVGISPQDLLTVRPVYDGAQRLSDAAVDATPILTRAELAATLSASLI